MKNNFFDEAFLCKRKLKKLTLIMKLTTLLSIVLSLNAWASGYSQNTRFTLDLNGKTVREVFQLIEDQSQFRFFYNDDFSYIDNVVSIDIENNNVEEILEKLFETSDITYKVFNDNLVVLTPKSSLQQVRLKGIITDEITGDPLPGANVQIKGTTRGAVADLNGNFTIEVNPGDVLIVSFIGYLPQEIPYEGQTELNVVLSPDVQNLDEVVVIGYGTAKKSDITGSVVTVNTQDMLKKAPTNILQGLKGMAAGVVITAQDGAPDANSAVYIRGIATINGTSKPLYVVDGVPVGDNANFLNPSDIERVEILKDASATAIYGSAGANGVIMVTTKRGTIGKAHISFSADYGIQTLARELDVTDANQYGINLRTARANDGNTIVNPIFSTAYDGKRKTINWQREMTRPALRQQYNLSATGGSEQTQYNVSVGYINHDGLVVNTNMNRLTGRASVSSKAVNFLEIGSDLSFSHMETKGSNATIGNNGNLSSIRDMAFFCPTMDYVDPSTGQYVSPNPENSNGTFGAPLQAATGAYDALITENILASQMEESGVTKNNHVLLNAFANVKLFKGLTFRTIGSYSYRAVGFRNFWGNTKRFMPDGVTEVERYNYNSNYNLRINNSQSNTLTLESYLTYNWSNEVHNLTIMAGNSVSKSFGEYSNVAAVDFPGENIRDISLTNVPSSKVAEGAYDLEKRTLSYFGRMTYSLKDRYILTGTIRRDGSSNFGVDNLWGTFPSAALAWRISEEDFLKGNSAISNLKLRLGWGQTGNAGNNGSRATAALTSNTIQYFYYPQGGAAAYGSTRILYNGTVKTLVDTRLKWETNEQTNVGIDLGVLNNALNITVDYFIRNAKDLLLYRNIRPSAGYTQVYTNYGEIENKGIEFTVDFKKRLNSDVFFGATLTGSSVKNKIKGIGVDQFFVNETSTNDGSNQGAVGTAANVHWDGHAIMRDGYAVGSYYGYEVEGIFQSQPEVDAANDAAVAAGHEYYQQDKTGPGDYKYRDRNGDGFIDPNDMTVLGNGFPKLNLGLTLTASYRNWDFSFYSYGVFGMKINSYSAMTLSNMFGSDNGTVPNILNSVSDEAWTPENHSTTVTKLSLLDYNRNMRGSDAWVKKGNFYKIGNIQIAYNLPTKLLTPLHLENARISFSVQNVLTISPYKKYGDPEIGQGDVRFTGLDTGRYPMPRTYNVGLTLQF